MQLFNIESILAVIILVLSILTIRSNMKRKKGLGEIIIATPGGLKYSDFPIQLLLIVLLAVLTSVSVFSDTTGKDFSLYYIVFPLALVCFAANALYLAMMPKGLFKNGVATNSGILFYDEIVLYDMEPRPKRNTIKVRFNPRKSIFGNGSTFEINSDQEQPVKTHLKKYCSFKKKTYTPPPKTKKK